MLAPPRLLRRLQTRRQRAGFNPTQDACLSTSSPPPSTPPPISFFSIILRTLSSPLLSYTPPYPTLHQVSILLRMLAPPRRASRGDSKCWTCWSQSYPGCLLLRD